ncbi:MULTISPECIES: transglycosylase domain-containing protein [unclassified Nitratiruptor]|uniref:transglycosylase domain-containing protein n=1 Tax=unclassified Nitratiruptor TaxID=2624044 RepID=UPI001916C58D|nr:MULTISPECIES: PBP1A family penicillin-binding protein [unclassified Nitratiruptor]BCD60824.1 penicillin-binding protein 1A [Nitratiruptor sp. YY08-10]BCD64756.1 penicillin-binding protein 1A [Nitratiruptor sp. YY08-14]
MNILKKIISFFFKILLILSIVGIGFGVYYAATLYKEVAPKADRIVNYHPQLTTKIYDRNGKLIANIFLDQNREYVRYEEIPPRVIEALLAIEDTKFFEHPGINFDAIFRALLKDIKARKFVEGASTITQQLVKNMVLSREKKLQRKIKEALIALEVERRLSKEQILERYLNQVFFGHGYYGIKTAAKGYFHKNLSQLTLKEIAMLVGLPRAPSYYDPTKHYHEALKRANRVITRMHELGWINEAMFTEAIQEKPKVYNDTLTKNSAPYIVDEVLRRFRPLFPDIKTGGYTIYTTIDLRLQKIAKKKLKAGYEAIKQRGQDYNYSNLNGALVALKPKTGEVLALVGGVDYMKSSFNRATQAKRQPGSAIKPFIYQIALNHGYSQITKIPDIARSYEFEVDGEKQIWKPKNYEKNFEGEIPLREALIHSRNLATINLVEDLGLANVYKGLKAFGFKNIPKDLSIALGSVVVSPLELAGLYSVFPNYGIRVVPRIVLTILDKNGKIVFESQPRSKKIEEPKQAFLIVDILRDVVKRGTGTRARVPGVEVAGKTGTTNNYVDAWFCGFTPDIETIVWFGQDDNSPLKKREAGGRASAPVVGAMIKEIYKLNPQLRRKFVVPEGVKTMIVDGKKIYYTDISKPSKEDLVKDNQEQEQLLF